jgi:hypothetical protein
MAWKNLMRARGVFDDLGLNQEPVKTRWKKFDRVGSAGGKPQRMCSELARFRAVHAQLTR